MDILNNIRSKAKKFNSKKIILPEHDDSRVLKSTYEILKQDFAKIVFLGEESKIRNIINDNFPDKEKKIFDNLEIFDYTLGKNINELIHIFKNIDSKVNKKLSEEDIKKIILNNKVYAAALLCRVGKYDGFLAGTVYTSKEVIRAVIHCLDRVKGISRISSSFIMVVPDCFYQQDGFFIFADCGIIENPSSKQIADITISSVGILESVCSGVEPKVALLSFSTKGSADGVRVSKVRESVDIIKKRLPGLLVDGELQVDAALVKSVADRKAPDSPIKGNANILIFPNLEAGNISYKLVQRLAGARAVGPVIQGCKVPCSDLSRGCSVEDIIDAVAVVSVIANKKNKNLKC